MIRSESFKLNSDFISVFNMVMVSTRIRNGAQKST